MSNVKNKISVVSFYLIILLLVSFIGCKNENLISPESELSKPNNNNVAVSFFSGSISDINSFNITEAKFVLRQMRLKVSEGETLADIRMEPFVVNLNLTTHAVITAAIATILSGNYHMLKLQIHKPSPQDNISDPDFMESNRSFSVVVKGFFNEEPFVFKSAITSARGIIIENSPIFIAPTVLVNFTITLNPYFWFYRSGELMNPMNQNNQHYIDDNIRDSFKRVFRDLDMNGQPD